MTLFSRVVAIVCLAFSADGTTITFDGKGLQGYDDIGNLYAGQGIVFEGTRAFPDYGNFGNTAAGGKPVLSFKFKDGIGRHIQFPIIEF